MIRIVTARRLAELRNAATELATLRQLHEEHKRLAVKESTDATCALAGYRQELQAALADLSSLRESHHRLWERHRAVTRTPEHRDRRRGEIAFALLEGATLADLSSGDPAREMVGRIVAALLELDVTVPANDSQSAGGTR